MVTAQECAATEQNMFRFFWERRLQVLDGILAGGETNLARVLAAIARHNAKFSLILENRDTDQGKVLTGGASWVPTVIDPGNRAAFPECTLMPNGAPVFAWTVVAGQLTVRPYYAHYDSLIVPFLRDLLRQRPVDAIVELGSGYSEKLFQLFLAGGPRGIPYYGAELWEPGRVMAERLACLQPDLDFRSVPLDLADPDFSFLAGYRRVLVFSNAALYCLPHLPQDFFERLTAFPSEMSGVHFEFVGAQCGSHCERFEEYYRDSVEREHNTNFIPLMRAAAARGDISISTLIPDVYVISSAQPVTIVRWTKGGQQ